VIEEVIIPVIKLIAKSTSKRKGCKIVKLMQKKLESSKNGDKINGHIIGDMDKVASRICYLRIQTYIFGEHVSSKYFHNQVRELKFKSFSLI
jgi:hypothetical protein